MIGPTSEWVEWLLSSARLWWFFVGFGYFLLGVFTASARAIDWIPYPWWFSSPALLASGAILLHINATFFFASDGWIVTHSEQILGAAAVFWILVFFGVAHVYAINREDHDAVRRGEPPDYHSPAELKDECGEYPDD